MVFEDRISKYPNRYLMTKEDGTASLVTLTRADEPIVEGTPLAAETFNELMGEIQMESEAYPGCYYRMVDNEREWINPPMELGVSYRTTERHNGSPVYVKRFTVNTPTALSPLTEYIDRSPYAIWLIHYDALLIEGRTQTERSFCNGMLGYDVYFQVDRSSNHEEYDLGLHISSNDQEVEQNQIMFTVKYTVR